ncbi:MAG TPA: DNA ligase D [Vicinamibacterales bacterium]|nr:DNA ligase D [Vicinamibacterales bacterium]
MLATLADGPLQDEQFVYEPKYDGIRALVEIAPAHGAAAVHLWSRQGNDKARQFPDIVGALAAWAKPIRAPLLLDGEIVALDERGEPAGFHRLQERIHLQGGIASRAGRQPAALVVFDLLREGTRDLRPLPLVARRARLERLMGDTGSPRLRLSEQVAGSGMALYRTAQARGWEGVMAKRATAPYRTGARSADWLKIKIVHRQEFVVGGWTDPRSSRSHFGALLLGVYEEAPGKATRGVKGTLRYVGHVGSGFTEADLARVAARLAPLATSTCPFREKPASNERPHWVKPTLVAEVKFGEWTPDGHLRAPVFLGLRGDVPAGRVRREEAAIDPRPSDTAPAAAPAARIRPARPSTSIRRAPADKAWAGVEQALLDQLDELQAAKREGQLVLPDGQRLRVSNLRKIFWPVPGFTKGDLLRYYVQAARFILPVIADRPLVMKRFPNGITGKSFYQQRAPDDPPPGVGVEELPDDDVPSRLVGGSLTTLLYMAQLGAVSQDPWLSRVSSPDTPDHVVLDLDPMPGVPFERILDVARWVRDELDALGAAGFPKTSGADGLHVYVPLPAGIPYDAGLLFCQIVATIVARKHPRQATVERTVQARGATVYVDYLQNIKGKTLATAYSARASDFAGVSTPLTWHEVDAGVDRRDFTIRTAPARFRAVGDLWRGLREAKGVDLHRVARYTGE